MRIRRFFVDANYGRRLSQHLLQLYVLYYDTVGSYNPLKVPMWKKNARAKIQSNDKLQYTYKLHITKHVHLLLPLQ